jgi:hypothetical protein
MMHSVIPLHHPARLRRRVPRRAVAAALLPLVGLAGAAQAQERPLPQTVGGNSALRQQRSAEYAALMQAQRYQMMLDRLIQQNLREVVNPPMVPFASLMLNDEARDEAIQARLSRMGGSPADYLRAMQHREMMPVATIKGTGNPVSSGGKAALSGRIDIATTGAKFQSLGPVLMDPPFNVLMGTTHLAGRVSAVAFDRTGAFYAATPGGGVWRFDPDPANPGLAWKIPVPLTDRLFPALLTSSIAIHPTDPRIIYVGTGDFDYGESLFATGIYKTVNGGKTWTNLGNGTTAQPPVANNAAAQMEGTSVSAILLDPENPNIIHATTGRGGNPGSLWRSVDGGNNWTRAKLTTGADVPAGDWSSITVGAPYGPPSAQNRAYYATRINDGVYRSDNRGVTWTRLTTVPFVYTGRGGNLMLKVEASKQAGNGEIVYIVDGSADFNDGRILKSLDRGITWTDVTGNFSLSEGGNNWGAVHRGLFIVSAPTGVDVIDVPTGNLLKRVPREGVYIGTNVIQRGWGAINQDGAIYGNNNQNEPIFRQDFGIGPDWEQFALIPGNPDFWFPHQFQKSFAVDPTTNPALLTTPFQAAVVANEGGVHSTTFTNGQFFSNGDGNLPSLFTKGVRYGWTGFNLNARFPVQQFVSADFMQIGSAPSGTIKVIGVSVENGPPVGTISLNPAVDLNDPVNIAKPEGTNVSAGQSGVSWNTRSPRPASATALPDALAAGTGNPPGPPNDNPNLIPPSTGLGGYPAMNGTLITASSFMFNPFDTTGRTQVLIGGASGNWSNTGSGGRRIWWTTDEWNTYMDITPDRFWVDGNNNIVRDGNNAGPLYVYNTMEPRDTTTPTNWQGEAKARHMPVAFGQVPQVTQVFTANNVTPQLRFPPANPSQTAMYVGAQFLWRYDPRGSLAKNRLLGPVTAPPDGPREQPNVDRGVWRRVGTTQLATGTNVITAIAVGEPIATITNRIYVGTSNGDVWMSTDAATNQNLATVPIPSLTATWTRIGGTDISGANWPARPVTKIMVNTDPPGAANGDIVVAFGGAPGVPHLWRATNTTGAATPVFTPVVGQGFASLPDVGVNDIARDPDDATNTWYVATDLGVFATIDAGSTWSNATAPLGLPNVEVTSIKVVPPLPNPGNPHTLMVATYGRGVWRFPLENLTALGANPNLKISSTFTRNASEILVNLRITNDNSDPTKVVGTAFNVRLTTANLTATGAPVNATNIPTGGFNVGTIAPGDSQTVTVRFPASVGRPGTAVVLRAGGTLTLPPFPPGTGATFNNNPGFRTRLP